ncbi:MAG: hypothetical protein E3J30_02945 [Anaerolineales bacterium]|nr:MAG: hypothetical protein E3J30_02945 [Anaerolineales bacterium]
MNHAFVRRFILPAALVFLAGCSIVSPFGGSEELVTFNVVINKETFSPEASLRVRIWNAETLKVAESNANCAVSYNQETQAEEVHCPEGVEYREVSPEEFVFLVQDLGAEIEIKSATVTVGEKYRLQISGLASDDCNTASATVEEKARSAHILFENLMWATTLMACP